MAEHNDIELVHTALRPLLLMLADFRNLNVNLLRVHSVVLERMCVYPWCSTETVLYDQFISQLIQWKDVWTATGNVYTALVMCASLYVSLRGVSRANNSPWQAHLHRWVEVILTTTQAKTARKTDVSDLGHA